MKRFGKIVIKNLIDLFELLVIGVAVFAFIYIFAGQLLRVTGDSMLPNFHDGEQIIAEKITIKLENLKRNDIVIFQHPTNPDKLVIKRVIGLPGDTIELENGKVYINGQALNESYLNNNITTMEGKFLKNYTAYKIPTDSYIFLGDNRTNSTDCRDWGPIKKELVVGKALLTYYPLNDFRIIE